MDKPRGVYPYNGISLSNKEQQTTIYLITRAELFIHATTPINLKILMRVKNKTKQNGVYAVDFIYIKPLENAY